MFRCLHVQNMDIIFDESIIFKSGPLKREDAVSVDFFPVNQHWKMTAYPRAGWQVDWMLRLLIGISGLASAFASYFVLKMLIKKNDKLDALVDKKTIELQKTNGELK